MSLFNRLKEALHQDNSITCTKEELNMAKGFSTEYLESLGLRKADLKKLERKGLAVRGYTQSPKGNRTRWIIVEKGDINEMEKP